MKRGPKFTSDWLAPFVGVLGFTVALYFLTYLLDFRQNAPPFPFLYNLFEGDVNTFRYSLSAAAQSLSATLGMMFAIVLVIAQLSANRYTPKIIESFTHNWMNIVVFSLYIASIVFSVWVINSTHGAFIPRYGAMIAMVLTGVCYFLVIPYFLYVFRILNPHNIIDQLRIDAQKAIRKAVRHPSYTTEMRKFVVRRLEQIADISMSSIQNVDEEVARHSILALQAVMHHYMREKSEARTEWHALEEDPLIGSPRRLAEEIIKRKAFVEFRALRQLRILYRHSSGRLPEINSLIAQVMRSMGGVAIEKEDFSVLELVVMFFNSLVRGAVILKDGRACGDTLYQYRLLAEKILETQPALTEKIVHYFIYYGSMILDIEIRQIFDLVCYDIRKINEKSMKIMTGNFSRPLESPVPSRILDDFLGFMAKAAVTPHHREQQYRALLKHYINLASFYLVNGQEGFAHRIRDRMSGVSPALLREIQREIEAITDPLFWEISDRVINFNFISSEQKAQLELFITWLEEPSEAAR